MQWWINLRTAFKLATRVNEVEQRCNELELEWINKRDSLDRLQRQLALRERRSAGSGADGDPDSAVEVAPPQSGKTAMRQYAREKGFIR